MTCRSGMVFTHWPSQRLTEPRAAELDANLGWGPGPNQRQSFGTMNWGKMPFFKRTIIVRLFQTQPSEILAEWPDGSAVRWIARFVELTTTGGVGRWGGELFQMDWLLTGTFSAFTCIFRSKLAVLHLYNKFRQACRSEKGNFITTYRLLSLQSLSSSWHLFIYLACYWPVITQEILNSNTTKMDPLNLLKLSTIV